MTSHGSEIEIIDRTNVSNANMFVTYPKWDHVHRISTGRINAGNPYFQDVFYETMVFYKGQGFDQYHCYQERFAFRQHLYACMIERTKALDAFLKASKEVEDDN